MLFGRKVHYPSLLKLGLRMLCGWGINGNHKHFTDRKDLDKIDWALLQRRDFSREPNDLAKFERYQAEFLIYHHCPISAIIGICCYDDNVKQSIQQLINTSGITLDVYSRPNWYL